MTAVQQVTAPFVKDGFVHEESAHEAAERGHAATDRFVKILPIAFASAQWFDSHGKPIVHFDPVAEAKLRLKIDLMIVPTVSILYLFCFIDRANIGTIRCQLRSSILTI